MSKEEAEKHVARILTDAAYDRARGVALTDAQVLAAALVEALTDPGTATRKAVR